MATDGIKDQQSMDGSPRDVERTLMDLYGVGKFQGLKTDTTLDPNSTLIYLCFQCGPIGEVGVNGCAIEDVIDVLVERMDGFQRGPFACNENAMALIHLRSAREALLNRTAKRQLQGVEGTNAAHVS